MITQQELQDLFTYDAERGVLVSRKTGKDLAWHFDNDGYAGCSLTKNKQAKYHRLVWIYHHGEPYSFVTHIDKIKTNNRIENLRLKVGAYTNIKKPFDAELLKKRINELFRYDEAMGELIYIDRKPTTFAGRENSYGEIMVNIDGNRYLAASLIWLVHFGEWVKRFQHLDGDLTNNRLQNLKPIQS